VGAINHGINNKANGRAKRFVQHPTHAPAMLSLTFRPPLFQDRERDQRGGEGRREGERRVK
jgi:hypothetical protein